MSHRATSWAFSQQGLKPATKLILVYLADCHNDHTGRCDPAQKTLAEGCGMSRSTVNLHLNWLEAEGYIRRVQRADKRTNKQENTLYILGCDDGKETGKNGGKSAGKQDGKAVSENRTRDGAEPCPNSRTRDKEKPCPKNRDSRVRKNGNPVSELSDTNRKLTGNKPRAGARGPARGRASAPAREAAPSEAVAEIDGWEVKVQAIRSGMSAMCSSIRAREALVLVREGLVSVQEARNVDLVTIADCRAAGIAV